MWGLCAALWMCRLWAVTKPCDCKLRTTHPNDFGRHRSQPSSSKEMVIRLHIIFSLPPLSSSKLVISIASNYLQHRHWCQLSYISYKLLAICGSGNMTATSASSREQMTSLKPFSSQLQKVCKPICLKKSPALLSLLTWDIVKEPQVHTD